MIFSFVALVLLIGSGCGKGQPKPINPDFTTPGGTVLCLFDAYHDGDVERVISCIDFRERGRARLKTEDQTEDRISELAQKLEEQLRKDLEKSFPDYKTGTPSIGQISTAEVNGKPANNLRYVNLGVTWPGAKSGLFPTLVAKSGNGWKAIVPLPWP